MKVKVELNKEACPQCIKSFGADAVILAIGSKPVVPPIKGIENTMTSVDAIDSPESIGQKVVIAGAGLVGCEIAYDEVLKGKDVTIVEALPEIMAAGLPNPIPNSMMIKDLFEQKKVNALTNHKVVEFKSDSVVVETPDGKTKVITADTIINALGFSSMPSMKDALEGLNVYEIGDAKQAANILTAISDGYAAGNNI